MLVRCVRAAATVPQLSHLVMNVSICTVRIRKTHQKARNHWNGILRTIQQTKQRKPSTTTMSTITRVHARLNHGTHAKMVKRWIKSRFAKYKLPLINMHEQFSLAVASEQHAVFDVCYIYIYYTIFRRYLGVYLGTFWFTHLKLLPQVINRWMRSLNFTSTNY